MLKVNCVVSDVDTQVNIRYFLYLMITEQRKSHLNLKRYRKLSRDQISRIQVVLTKYLSALEWKINWISKFCRICQACESYSYFTALLHIGALNYISAGCTDSNTSGYYIVLNFLN